jgi:hypothetical protein
MLFKLSLYIDICLFIAVERIKINPKLMEMVKNVRSQMHVIRELKTMNNVICLF